MRKFRFKDHTADIAMAVTGTTAAELFAHAAEGLAAQLFSAPEKLSCYTTVRTEIRLEAPSREDLLVDWLNELIYLFYGEGILFRSAVFARLDDQGLVCSVEGYAIPTRDRMYAREVKAATYHGLKIADDKEILRAEVILDI